MKPSHALAHIRQLCCLGLGKEAVMPELLRAIQSVIPSGSNLFVGLNEDFFPTYSIYEFMVPEVTEIFAGRTRQVYGPVQSSVAQWYRRHRLLDDPAILAERFDQTDFYNLCWRPLDQHHVLQGLVRHNGALEGALSLFRPRSQRPFNAAEKIRFERLLPYVEHALRGCCDAPVEHADSGPTGLLILDQAGSAVYLSDSARNLLRFAMYPLFPVGGKNHFQNGGVPPELAELCRNLQDVFHGKAAPPPVWIHTNPRGRFVFRAYWLDRQGPDPGGMIGVTVEHREPSVLRILRGMRDLPLSPVQREVCLLLAQNHSQESITQRLNIRPTTVKDHVRKLYDKLDIHGRDELLPRLTDKTGDPR